MPPPPRKPGPPAAPARPATPTAKPPAAKPAPAARPAASLNSAPTTPDRVAPARAAAPAKAAAAPAAKAPARPAPKPPPPTREPFIGADTATMMADETFEEFEERLRQSGERPMPSEADEEAPDEVEETPDEAEEVDEADDEGADEPEDDGEDGGDDEPADDDEDDAPPKPWTKKGPTGRPVDRFGEEWDYVSHEGMGFNDDDDEDAMTFEKNGKSYFKPDWGPLRPSQWKKFWATSFALEAAMANDDDDEYQAALKKHGFRNRNHWKRVQACFTRHYADDPEFTNAALEARQEQARGMMRDAVKPGMLDPIEGVSIQVYAGIAAQQMSVQGPAFVKLLAKHGMDEAKFARVAEGWQARMSDQSDPMASAAIATEYGKAFAGAGVGQYGASAAAASESLGINDKVAGQRAKGAEGGMSFEKFVEVMSAQSAWASQGKDVNQMLKKVFNMNAADWSNASAVWSQKLGTDVKLVSKFGELQTKYMQKYMAGAEDPDADLDV